MTAVNKEVRDNVVSDGTSRCGVTTKVNLIFKVIFIIKILKLFKFSSFR